MSLLAANDALQAVERMYIEVKKDKDNLDDTVLQTSRETLDNLRHTKSVIEGSDVTVTAPELTETCLLELRQLTLMHLPSSLTDEVRNKFQTLIFQAFKGEEVEVLFAVLMTCPWYACTQKERGEQAKHNHLFIVYQSSIDKFFSPVNAHLVDQSNVVDKEWLYATELYHFVHFLTKGRTRNVEALYCPPEAVLYQTAAWKSLRKTLPCGKVLGLRGFLEACRGQSVGGIGKKGKDGKYRMKDSTTFRELCDSFRLMHHAYNSTQDLPPCTEMFDQSQSVPDIARRAVDLFRSMYQNLDVSKKDAFNLLCEWSEMVKKNASPSYTKPEEVGSIVGNWHMGMRLRGSHITPLQCPEDEQSKLVSLMEEIGGPVSKLQPEQIVLITRAGSYMYGLSTPTSDTDYVIVYTEKTETVLTACKRLPEIVENRGPQKEIEYGAYEVRCFAEMLLKGSVVILELVYKDNHNYMSPAWKALAGHKDKFLSERAIQQYMGLIKNNFKMIQSGKQKDSPQERKLFYQIYHKMDSLGYFLTGVTPPVQCSGTVRDFIMKVRTAPLEGELSRNNLLEDALCKFDKLRDDLANRRLRLPEDCDFNLLVDWILTVRGINRSQ